jgi:hypothetical protein
MTNFRLNIASNGRTETGPPDGMIPETLMSPGIFTGVNGRQIMTITIRCRKEVFIFSGSDQFTMISQNHQCFDTFDM